MKHQENISCVTKNCQSETQNPAGGLTAPAGGDHGNVPPVPALNQSVPIEVMRDFGTVLFFGKLAAADAAELTITRIPGEADFPENEAESAVLVRGYDAGMNPVLLSAKVIRASAAECTVGELKLIPYKTQRKQVRYPVKPPVNIYSQDDTALCRPQPCQLHNISTGGACIVSEHPYELRQQLRLRIGLDKNDAPSSYCCQVVRVTPRKDKLFEYGLLFVHMDESERGSLMRDIRMIQKETEKKMLYGERHV